MSRTTTPTATVEIIGGRKTNLQPKNFDTAQSVKVIDTPEYGRLTVNPDNSHSLVMTQLDNISSINFTSDALSVIAIAAAEGPQAWQINDQWLADNPQHGSSPDTALDYYAGMMLWGDVEPSLLWLRLDAGYTYQTRGIQGENLPSSRTHEIELLYFEYNGYAGLRLEWESPGINGTNLVEPAEPNSVHADISSATVSDGTLAIDNETNLWEGESDHFDFGSTLLRCVLPSMDKVTVKTEASLNSNTQERIATLGETIPTISLLEISDQAFPDINFAVNLSYLAEAKSDIKLNSMAILQDRSHDAVAALDGLFYNINEVDSFTFV